MSEADLLKRLPFARGQQYLCALALNNGASPVWLDEYDYAADVVDERREGARQVNRRGEGDLVGCIAQGDALGDNAEHLKSLQPLPTCFRRPCRILAVFSRCDDCKDVLPDIVLS